MTQDDFAVVQEGIDSDSGDLVTQRNAEVALARIKQKNRKLRMCLMVADALAEGYAQGRSKDAVYWRYVSAREDLVKESK